MTVASEPISSRTASRSSIVSSSESVGPSPVVPATTTPCEPFSTRYEASLRAPSMSSERSSANGVTIAVRTPRKGVIADKLLRERGRETVRPGLCTLELRRDLDQEVLPALRSDELDADRQAVRLAEGK